MVEREAPGDFDYLWDDSAESDGLTSDDEVLEGQPAGEFDTPSKDTGDDLWDEPDDNFWDKQPDSDDFPTDDSADTGHFDAFNDDTWKFTPTPPPWYRTKQALTAMVAASAAVVAIVVAGVLLVFRGPAGTVDEVTPTAPTSAESVPVATSAEPPPPLPPPPPPETALPVTAAPREGPAYQPRQTKAPEIGVTRTPVTRAPMSVAPQPRTGQRGTR